MMQNVKALREFGKFEIRELAAIVHDQHLWEIEVTDDEHQDEDFYFSFGTTDERFGFYLLCKVVNDDKQELSLS